jgi:HlyD family secretion protein
VALVAVVVLVAAVVAMRLPKRSATLGSVTTEAVSRQDISVTVEATGTVEPINLVEVKSKASGQITRMPVEIGSRVKPGDLLVQVDPRDVQNAFDQAQAALVAAQAKAQVAREQRRRSDELLAGQVITASEHEAATLEEANAQSSLIAARTNLDLARQRLEDATVRAPIAGTVLSKPVAVGQVISSATSSVSGGTTLLTMADLRRIRMRALVVETDIGNVHEGQSADVIVDAYPQRTFRGVVEKIEPQAVVQQSVTMFPVLISISNDQNLLLPGMNGEVTMLVQERRGVLAVPVDAVRSVREMATLAEGLGIDLDSLRANGRSGAAGDSAGRGRSGWRSGADSLRARRGGGADSAGAGRRAGRDRGIANAAEDAERLARMRQRAARRMSGASAGGDGPPPPPDMIQGRASAAAAEAVTGASSGSRRMVALVKSSGGLAPRLVRTGLTNYDYAEVLDGLQEGEQVVLLGVLEVQQQRDRTVSRVRERVGGGLPGTTGGGGSTRSGGTSSRQSSR